MNHQDYTGILYQVGRLPLVLGANGVVRENSGWAAPIAKGKSKKAISRPAL